MMKMVYHKNMYHWLNR